MLKPLAALISLALITLGASAQVTTQRIISGLSRPVWAGAPAGDPRIFVATKGGEIYVYVNGLTLPTPFLSLVGDVSTGSEQGLLGVAFHPDFGSNGSFFVNYTNLAGSTVVSRFQVSADPNVADEASQAIVLTQTQPFSNHNGGDVHFGPDGYLYVFFGDGGSANDPSCRAQRLDVLLGKIVRIDVDGATPYAIPPTNPFIGVAGARPEIFHLGVRNPWRNAFDALTGDLYIGDVGQDQREEISVAPAGSVGLNFGWKVMEGTRCNSTSSCALGTPPCNDPGYVGPITELLHSTGSFAITGGTVYRGCLCPSEYGKYFFADFVDDRIRSLVYDPATGTVSGLTDRTVELAPGGGLSITNIASFGVDGFGELLILDHSSGGAGEVFKMVPAPAQGALSDVRNGTGVNPFCLEAATLPILGNVWEVRVDASVRPAAIASYLVAYAAPSPGVLGPFGERLYDATSTRYLRVVQPSTGTIDVFRAPLPCDAGLAGLTLTVQAGVVGGGTRQLCNALDLTAGSF
jgi:glucose/arabinose dehydrogenase